jgi:F-type H+-transporting ATPase subunit alpha
MTSISRARRELVIGDWGTEQSTIAIDRIINQGNINREGVPSIPFVWPVDKKFYDRAHAQNTHRPQCMELTIVNNLSAADRAAKQDIPPCAGCTMDEWFLHNGVNVLIVENDLSKHAMADRQTCLIFKSRSGQKADPDDAFYLDF